MHIDITLMEKDLNKAADLARDAEAVGHAGVWATETGNDPFLQAFAALGATERVTVGTAIAVAFARTPMTVAYSAWNLAQVSDGRFVLGLGSQVKAHVERRYSMRWGKPVEQMREFVLATRAIWESWRTGAPLEHAGAYYTHTLMTDFWAPAPYDGDIPIHLAAVGPRMSEMAGEVADGVLLHTFTNPAYLAEVTWPAIDKGLRTAGRTHHHLDVSLPLFMVMGDTDQELAERHATVAKQLAFYASTRAYRPVLEAIGFGDLQPALTELSKRQAWDEMTALVSDEVFDHFVITGRPEEMAARARKHLGDRVTRVTSYLGWPVTDRDRLQELLAGFDDEAGASDRKKS